MKKLAFEEVIDRCEKLVNNKCNFPSFSSYYITDNDCNDTKEKPYKLKRLWFSLIYQYRKNENNKYSLSEEQKQIFKNRLIETFNKENIYWF